MDQRKSDPRIYIVTLLFLSCILSGGVLLGLYLLLPDPNPLFLQAGMVFVGVPWLFWFLAYLYSCVLKPCTVSVTRSVAHFDPEKGDHNKNNNIPDNTTSASDPDPVTPVVQNSPMEGEKHVQFGNVEVFGGEQGGKEESEGSSTQNNTRSEEEKHQEIGRLNSRSDDDDYDDDDDDNDESSFDEDCDRTPLRLSVANK